MAEASVTIILSILGAGAIAILGWALVTTHNNSKKIAVLETSFTRIHADCAEIKNDIQELKYRLDLFLKAEIDTLKGIFKQDKQ